jgi:RsiW-degrading membrane proteinase PrsW (M82 family)
MLDYMTGFFVSFFSNPSAAGIGLAIAFGAIWLTCFWTPILRKPWLIAVMAVSAILALAAIAFIQIPLQILAGQSMAAAWDEETLANMILLIGFPQIALSGLVQEGAKMLPAVYIWWRSGKQLTPKAGLLIGAAAGAGFGLFEAQWVHNLIFASGWSWDVVQTGGIGALGGFAERFFVVAFHTAASALTGYGLAKGWGWQFYLIASFLHTGLNYSVVFKQTGMMTDSQIMAYIIAWTMAVTAWSLWIRWKKLPQDDAEPIRPEEIGIRVL